jgi:hypothetical protein
MRTLGLLTLVLCLGAMLALTTACRPQALPGTSAGSFTVTESIRDNACAPGFAPRDTFQYVAELRLQDQVAYWHTEGSPIVNGSFSPTDGHFHFSVQTTVTGYAGDDAGMPGCVFTQTETIDGTLSTVSIVDSGVADAGSADDASESADGGMDAGVADDASQPDDAGAVRDASSSHGSVPTDAGPTYHSFTGTDTIVIGIASGSDCRAALAANGGPFPALPCTATYDIRATR